MIFLLLSGALGLALVAWSFFVLFKKPIVDPAGFYPNYPHKSLALGGRSFRVAVADSIAARTQGLSGLESMAEDDAMLFIFPAAMRYSFWMKGMMFPLDMIWMRNGAIVDISENIPAPPSGESMASLMESRVRPKAAADSVLEVSAGTARKIGIKTGDRVDFPK